MQVARLAVAVLGVVLWQIPVQAQTPARSADQVYRTACAACHGADGRGAPRETVGFDTPLPDFTDCSFATREPDADWFAIAHAGGPVRAFDRRMPAFGEALTAAEIQQTIDHIRTFCREPAWPSGELNLPRPLVTEKAYPEDEAVVTAVIDSGDTAGVTHQVLYEKRFGARNQIEVGVPIALREDAGGWARGLGDVVFAFKRALAHSRRRGSIFSVIGEVILPTGKETEGLGKGATIVEPALAFGQILPASGFLHLHAGAELSTQRSIASHEAFWRVAAGRTFEQAGFGRAWSPMVELLAGREFEDGARVEWDVVPQMQVTLSKRQHIMISGGVRLPVNQRVGRHPQVIAYFLWDWFDGGLRDGWR